MGIGTRIKEARKEKGISQAELAEQIGVTKGAIGNFEAGNRSPKDDILFLLMRALDVDANYLFQDEMESFERATDMNPFNRALLIAFHASDENIKEGICRILKVPMIGSEGADEPVTQEEDRQ